MGEQPKGRAAKPQENVARETPEPGAVAATPAQDPVAAQLAAMEARMSETLAGVEQRAQSMIDAAEQRAAEAEQRTSELLAERGVASPSDVVLARLTELLERQAEQPPIVGPTGKAMTFAQHESADAVIQSLEGTVKDRGEDDDELDEPVVFRSKGSNFCVVRKARQRWASPTGEAQITTGIAMDFAPHGEFRTSSRQNAEWLRSRGSFNVEFWEVGKEPHAAPSPDVVIERIMEAVVDLDDQTLEALQREEEQTHKRPVVLKSISAARERVQGIAGGVAEGA